MTNQGLIILKSPQVIQVKSAFPIMPLFKNFSYVVTIDGENQFTLPGYPILTGLVCVNIDGITQDAFAGDYTINGNILTVNATLYAGQKVAGFFQAMSSDINPTILSYRNFYFVADQDQKIFSLDFTPKTVIYVGINGTLQSVIAGDYIVSANLITTNNPLDQGDKIFGLAIQ